MVDVKQVEDTDIIDQLIEQFEVDLGSKIFPAPGKTLFEYLQKMCNSNQETILCPRYSTVFDSRAAKAFKSSKIKRKVEEAREKGKEDLTTSNIPSNKLVFQKTPQHLINLPKINGSESSVVLHLTSGIPLRNTSLIMSM